MESKYLVIVIGREFVKPMLCYGEKAIALLTDESKNYYYLYLIYKYNEYHDVYMPMYRLREGMLNDFDSTLVKGVYA